MRAFVAISQAPRVETTSTVTVTGRGPSPGVSSGILMTTVLIAARTEDGVGRVFHLPFMSEDTPLPALGARCVFHHRVAPVDLTGGLQTIALFTGDVVGRFECDATSRLPAHPSDAEA
jgi:hypothetical protein